MKNWKIGKLENWKTERRFTLYLALFFHFLIFLFSISLSQSVELERQVFDIARELRCPVCVAEAVSDSNADVSIEMREIIQQQLEEGRNRQEILAYFQERYGDWILLEPPRRGIHLIVWLLPVIFGLVSAATLIYFFRRWTQRSKLPVEASEEDLARVREALES